MSKGQLIDSGADKRYVRCDKDRKFEERVYVSRSLSADGRHDAEKGRQVCQVTRRIRTRKLFPRFANDWDGLPAGPTAVSSVRILSTAR
jgi:hypothetical protein